MNELVDKLSRYMDSGFPVLYVHSFEELSTMKSIIKAAGARKVLEWGYAEGLTSYKNGELQEEYKGELALIPLESVLEQLLDRDLYKLAGKVLVFKDIHCYLEHPEIVLLLKEMIKRINMGEDYVIVILSPVVKVPVEIEKFVTIFELEYMSFDEIREEIKNFIKIQELAEVDDKLISEIAMAFKGLTKFEIDNLLALAYSDDGELTKSDLKIIFDQKQQMIMKSGILEMVSVKETIEDIGGLENLKEWFKRKATVIKNINEAEKFGVAIPKGVLIAGVPGCGKSLNAKAAASLFEVPLLRMDMGRLMGKYVGESEGNMRRAIALAEAIAPCVLWIDELEKAFAGINGNGGGGEVTTRLFGSFLTWMQEKESAVFVVATANNIMALPPELMRKGRFDEIFFVDLPTKVERKKIFKIHIQKHRKQDFNNIDIDELVNASEGFSGADIEGVVKDAIEDVFADGSKVLTTNDILKTINNTHSLSEIMKEPLAKLHKEYQDRKFKKASI